MRVEDILVEEPHDVVEELCERLELDEPERREYRIRLGHALISHALEIMAVSEAELEEI